jgi:hypothetical protein
MKKLHQKISDSGRRVLALPDNARYNHALLHTEWRANGSNKFAQMFLPLKRVWKPSRRLAIPNHCFEKIDQVAETVEAQFDLWRNPNKTLRGSCVMI